MRISKNDRQVYDRLMNKVVRKIKNTYKKHNIDLTGEISLKPLESMTRKEFNEFKYQANVMTKRGVPRYTFVKLNDNVSVNKIQERRYKEAQQKAIKKAENRFNELKDKDFYQDNQPIMKVGTYIQSMKNPDIIGVNAPSSYDLKDIPSIQYLESKTKQLENFISPRKTSKLENQLKENYIEVLKSNFGDDANTLIEKIKLIDSRDFSELYSINSDVSIGYLYIIDADESKHYVENISNYLDKYFKGGVDMDFKRARDNII